MRQRKLSTFWKNIFKILFHLAGPTFLLLAIFFLPGRLIKIKKVVCGSQYGECPEEINSKLQTLPQSGLLNSKQILNSKKQIQKLLGNDLLISDFSIQYSFPNKLRVNILLKKAKFSVLNKETGMHLLFDAGGHLLGKTNETSLPVVAQDSDTPNLFALSIMQGIFSMYQVNRGDITGESLVVELPNGKRVIFPLEGDKDLLLGSLRLIYSEVMDKEIDLRFKNPVLR